MTKEEKDIISEFIAQTRSTILWIPAFEKMFPAGPTDPNVVFIKFKTIEVTTFFAGKLEHYIL